MAWLRGEPEDCPRTRRRRADAERNRAALADAARQVFAEQGLDAPLEHIARRAEVGIATLYRHFPSRAELLDAVGAEALGGQVELAERAAALDDPWAALTRLLAGMCLLAAEDPCVPLLMSVELPGGRTGAVRDRCVGLIAGVMARAQHAGQLRADLTVTDLACLTWANCHLVGLTSAVAPDAWRRHLALMLDGLRPAAASPLPVPALTEEQLTAAMADRGRQVAGPQPSG